MLQTPPETLPYSGILFYFCLSKSTPEDPKATYMSEVHKNTPVHSTEKYKRDKQETDIKYHAAESEQKKTKG